MKATISAICILTFIIAACFASTFYTRAVCNDIADSLEDALELIRIGKTPEAEKAFISASEKWKTKNNNLKTFIEHIELSDIEDAFSRVNAAFKTGDMHSAAVEISVTVDLLNKLTESDTVTLHNIL